MSDVFENKGALAATIVVAASNSLNQGQANYVCDGVNDHVEIQAALDALPATGGEVLLLDGTYNIEVSLVMDSYQTLRACGRNTILTTSTDSLIFLSAIGGAGTEKIGIVIADLQIDGANTATCGVYFEYVDYSFIQNIYSRRHTAGAIKTGICLINSDSNTISVNICNSNGNHGIHLDNQCISNTIVGNSCQGNSQDGILLYTVCYNTVTGNTCQGNSANGLSCQTSADSNTITGNTFRENGRGIYVHTSYGNTLSANTCQGNRNDGILIYNDSNKNTITGNTCEGNGNDGIALDVSLYNTISANTCQGNINGIYLYSLSHTNTIVGNSCQGNSNDGIFIEDSSDNTVTGNTCQGNGNDGITLDTASNNSVTGNFCQGNAYGGIYLIASTYNAIAGNTCQGNSAEGILLDRSSYNTITGNTCQGNNYGGISLYTSSNHNAIIGNMVTENSQDTTNNYDDIYVGSSDYNNIQSNTCRAGILVKKPRYGINISNAACDGNVVIDNDLYNDGFGTRPFNDAGTGTKLNTYKVPFSSGSDPQDSGFLADGAAEMARAWLRLPDKVVQVVRMKVYARSVVAEADKMRGEFVIYGGADNEAYNTHDGSVANHPSTSSNFAADDIIYWTVTTAGVLALVGGDSVEVKVIYEDAADGDCATNAYFRTVEIEYV